jgi:hypothetical protein
MTVFPSFSKSYDVYAGGLFPKPTVLDQNAASGRVAGRPFRFSPALQRPFDQARQMAQIGLIARFFGAYADLSLDDFRSGKNLVPRREKGRLPASVDKRLVDRGIARDFTTAVFVTTAFSSSRARLLFPYGGISPILGLPGVQCPRTPRPVFFPSKFIFDLPEKLMEF